MRHLFVPACLALVACDAPPSVQAAGCSDFTQMAGAWDVELLFDPGAPPSTTTMTLAMAQGEMSGTFYDSPFDAAKMIMTGEGDFAIAMTTRDGRAQYFHSARFDCETDRFQGQTLSPKRDFLMSWTAERSGG